MSFFGELKRRNVIRVGIAYLLMAWVLLQGADFALDLVDAPNWVIQTLSIIAALGLPVALFFAWAFELTPEGVKREGEVSSKQSITPQTGRKLDRLIMVVLVIAVAALLADRFTGPADSTASHQAQKASAITPAAAANPNSVAVLPFVPMSNGPDDGYFADGLTEEILNSLAQLPELLVTSRTSAFTFKGQDIAIEDVARQLGVANIVEGSVRRSGDRLRVTAQLIRAADGFHLWSKTYDSDSADAIAVQEDIAEKIAEALDVVLDDTKRAEMQRAGLRDVEAFIALQKGYEYFASAHGQAASMLPELRRANRQFEIVQKLAPNHARAWVLHADLYTHLLINLASGEPIEEGFEEEAGAAVEMVVYDHEMAAQAADTEALKSALQWDQAYLAGNWRGTARRNELVNRQEGCDIPQWGDMLTIAYGYGEGYEVRRLQRAECDVLQSRSWSDVAASRIWLGEGEGALEALKNIPETGQNDHFVSIQALALMLLGQPEEARGLVDSLIVEQDMLHFLMGYLAAHEGDLATAQKHYEQFQVLSEWGRFRELVMLATLGDREAANRAAAEIDQNPYGYLALPMVVQFCLCGAPWEIEHTPNFKARFDETGLEWPPSSPITFPLKDW